MSDEQRIAVRIAVLTVSDTRDEHSDKSGNLLVERLKDQGHILHEKCILPDDIYQVRAQVAQWIADPQVQAIVSTGGTGLTGRDGTPEAVEPLGLLGVPRDLLRLVADRRIVALLHELPSHESY